MKLFFPELCPALTLVNGSVTYEPRGNGDYRYSIGSANFKCNEGLVPHGPKRIVCQYNPGFFWSMDPPVCRERKNMNIGAVCLAANLLFL